MAENRRKSENIRRANRVIQTRTFVLMLVLLQWMVWPMTVMEPEHSKVELISTTPSSSAADSVRILKVEPGS